MQRFDVCVVGSANLDVVARTRRHPSPGETVLGDAYHEYPGGKGLNQAVAAARSGAAVAFVGAVGDDDAGRRLVQVLVDDSIDADGVVVRAEPTGRALIVVDTAGENSIVVVPGANAQLTRPSVPEASVVLCQLEVPLAAVVAAFTRAARRGAITVLNPAPVIELPGELIAQCDVIVPNEHEVELLGGAEALLSAGCGTVVVTRGGDGIDVYTSGGVRHRPAVPVDVADTTGAGDAFCGALATRLAAGDGVWEATRWAAAAGALATTRHGAVPAQPHAAAIQALLDSSNE